MPALGTLFNKETRTQVFSVKSAKIFENTLFEKNLRMVASLSHLLELVKVNKIN